MKPTCSNKTADATQTLRQPLLLHFKVCPGCIEWREQLRKVRETQREAQQAAHPEHASSFEQTEVRTASPLAPALHRSMQASVRTAGINKIGDAKRTLRERLLLHFKTCPGCIKCKKWEAQLRKNQEKQREAQQAAPPEQAPTPSLDAPSFEQIDERHVAAAASVLGWDRVACVPTCRH